MVKRGEAFKVVPGLYSSAEPTPTELAEILLEHWPDAVLDGESAIAVACFSTLQFPVQLACRRALAPGSNFTTRRTRRIYSLDAGHFRFLPPPLAVEAVPDDDRAVELLERTYAGRDGEALFERDFALIDRYPARTRRLLNSFAIGTDSPAEIAVVRALRTEGYALRTNYRIGGYLWDIVIPEHRVAIEINGFDYHNRRGTYAKDLWKSNGAVVRGWLALSYTGSCVKHHLPRILAEVGGVCGRTDYLAPPVWDWHVHCRDWRIR